MNKSDSPVLKMGLLAFALAVAGIHSARANQELVDSGHTLSRGTVKVGIEHSGRINLEVREATLEATLDALANKVGVPIRHTHVPEQPVTLTCRGEDLRSILRCLLGTDADLLFQHSAKKIPAKGAAGLSGVTILASTFRDEAIETSLTAFPDSSPIATRRQSEGQSTVESAMGMIRSQDAEERASGLELLGRINGVDKDELRAAYQNGLKDQDGEVRATALSGISILDRDNSFSLLSEAMSDEDPSVRLAAIDGMEVNKESRPYLEKALSDPDESVRELAGLRLGLIQ